MSSSCDGTSKWMRTKGLDGLADVVAHASDCETCRSVLGWDERGVTGRPGQDAETEPSFPVGCLDRHLGLDVPADRFPGLDRTLHARLRLLFLERMDPGELGIDVDDPEAYRGPVPASIMDPLEEVLFQETGTKARFRPRNLGPKQPGSRFTVRATRPDRTRGGYIHGFWTCDRLPMRVACPRSAGSPYRYGVLDKTPVLTWEVDDIGGEQKLFFVLTDEPVIKAPDLAHLGTWTPIPSRKDLHAEEEIFKAFHERQDHLWHVAEVRFQV